MSDGPLFCIGNEAIPLLSFACIIQLAHLEVSLSLQRLLAFTVVTVELPDEHNSTLVEKVAFVEPK